MCEGWWKIVGGFVSVDVNEMMAGERASCGVEW